MNPAIGRPGAECLDVDAVRDLARVGCEATPALLEHTPHGVARDDDAVRRARQEPLHAAHQARLPDDLAHVPDMRPARHERRADAVEVMNRVRVNDGDVSLGHDPRQVPDRAGIIRQERGEKPPPAPCGQLFHPIDDEHVAAHLLQPCDERTLGRERDDRMEPRAIETLDEAHERDVRAADLGRGMQVEDVTRHAGSRAARGRRHRSPRSARPRGPRRTRAPARDRAPPRRRARRDSRAGGTASARDRHRRR